jgi:hypothetical protein
MRAPLEAVSVTQSTPFSSNESDVNDVSVVSVSMGASPRT